MAKPLRISLELEPTEPVSGSLASDGQGARPFSGWLQLHLVLERLWVEARSQHGAGSLAQAPREESRR